jgi:uncharacterized damage-inducible protein DinB
MRSALLVLAAILGGGFSTALHAQNGASGSTAVSTARLLWEPMIGYITAVAEELPENKYSYRPTPEVRSFGEMFGHVAGAQYMFCAMATGEPPRQEDDIEKSKKSKADLVAALKASTEYCNKAYAQDDRAAQGKIKLFGQERTRLHALGMNATHDAEHYGNLVTYMRINKMVPPSSRRQ